MRKFFLKNMVILLLICMQIRCQTFEALADLNKHQNSFSSSIELSSKELKVLFSV